MDGALGRGVGDRLFQWLPAAVTGVVVVFSLPKISTNVSNFGSGACSSVSNFHTIQDLVYTSVEEAPFRTQRSGGSDRCRKRQPKILKCFQKCFRYVFECEDLLALVDGSSED